MQERLQTKLASHKKKMDKIAREALFERVGFDLRTLSNSLDKLIHYVGERSAIQTTDVQAVLERTRQDPIYTLTNAVADRSVHDALFYLNSLLSEGLHPLQILAGIVNQTRKLLIAKDSLERLPANQFQPGNALQPVLHDRLAPDSGRRQDVWGPDQGGGKSTPGAGPEKIVSTTETQDPQKANRSQRPGAREKSKQPVPDLSALHQGSLFFRQAPYCLPGGSAGCRSAP